ncbi:MAG: hypothetical protein WC891_08635 [Actinomycetota bacterium]
MSITRKDIEGVHVSCHDAMPPNVILFINPSLMKDLIETPPPEDQIKAEKWWEARQNLYALVKGLKGVK